MQTVLFRNRRSIYSVVRATTVKYGTIINVPTYLQLSCISRDKMLAIITYLRFDLPDDEVFKIIGMYMMVKPSKMLNILL